MEDLSNEVLYEIALNLDFNSLINLCRTNTRFLPLCDDYNFWRNIIYRKSGINVSSNMNLNTLKLIYKSFFGVNATLVVEAEEVLTINFNNLSINELNLLFDTFIVYLPVAVNKVQLNIPIYNLSIEYNEDTTQINSIFNQLNNIRALYNMQSNISLCLHQDTTELDIVNFVFKENYVMLINENFPFCYVGDKAKIHDFINMLKRNPVIYNLAIYQWTDDKQNVLRRNWNINQNSLSRGFWILYDQHLHNVMNDQQATLEYNESIWNLPL